MSVVPQLIELKKFIFISALLIVSWWGAVDNLAAYVNGESIKDAAIIYGVARSINGVISLLQSAELSLPFVSVNPGELLDPINDLVERFSSVMAWSLSSLVLQKILLAVFSSYYFKIILTILCILLLFSEWFRIATPFTKRIWTLFLIVASLRFSIAIICALTAAIDYSFIQKIEEKSLGTIQDFNSDISNGIEQVTGNDEAIIQELADLELHYNEIILQLNKNQLGLDALKGRLDQEPKPSIWGRITGDKKSAPLKTIEKQIDDKKIVIQNLAKTSELLKEEIECAEIKKTGESCKSSLSKIKDMLSEENRSEIQQKINQAIDDFITVLVSLVLTTIILPLIFLYLSLKLFRLFISRIAQIDPSS